MTRPSHPSPPRLLIKAENVMNKHSRTTDNVWTYSLGVGREANNFLPLETNILWNATEVLVYLTYAAMF